MRNTALFIGLTLNMVFAGLVHADWNVPTGTYGLDKTHGYISFTYSHLGFSNPQLGFDDFEVSLQADPAKPEQSQLQVTIAAASIDSRVALFDEHLNGEQYFDTAKYPEIAFRSKEIVATGENTFDVVGELTIKDVTAPLTLRATINKAGNHPISKLPTIGVSATGTLSRSAWGLSQYTPLVGDEVSLSIEVELPQQQ